MSNHDEALRRAHIVERFVNDPVIAEALAATRQGFIDEWLESEDRDAQYAAWAKTRALDALDAQFRRILSEGEYATAVLNKRQ